MKKALTMATLCTLLAVAAVSAGQAQSGDWKDSILLNAITDADDPKAGGVAEFGSERGSQFFNLRVFADLPDGTVLVASIQRVGFGDSESEWTVIGSLTMQLGSALLMLRESDYDTPVFPVENLRAIRVTHKGKIFLYGIR